MDAAPEVRTIEAGFFPVNKHAAALQRTARLPSLDAHRISAEWRGPPTPSCVRSAARDPRTTPAHPPSDNLEPLGPLSLAF